MDVSMELYKVFYFVAKNLSFSKAAEKLFISQSAVSQSIRQLEHKLGITLLIRNTKNVYLTIDGELLYKYLEQAFSLVEKAEKDLTMRQNPEKGELHIASTDTICKYYLLPKIKELSHKYPKIKIKITNGTSPFCMSLLEKADIDLAIVNLESGLDKKKFSVEKEYLFKNVFVASAERKEEFKKAFSLVELAKQPLLVLDAKTVTRKFFDEMFAKKGIAIVPEIEVQSIELLLEMAKAGLGISYVPDICLKNERELVTVKISERIPSRKFGLLKLKQMPISPVGELFKEIM